MSSREEQDLIDEFGPVPGISVDEDSAEKTQPGVEAPLDFEFEVDGDGTKPADSSPDGQKADDEPHEDSGEILNGVTFDFIGAEPESSRDQIGVDPVSAELASTKDKLLRLAAEFENFKKRRIREKDEQQKYANERLLKDLLPVLDNLERALDSARQTGGAANIISGLDLVVHEFHRVLSREGVQPLPAIGKPFDPAYQEALQSIETPDSEPGTVIGEILKGYTIYGRVLRPGLVVVAREPQN